MTQENKQLLLKDLCARLPYGVMVFVKDYNEPCVVEAIYDNLDVQIKGCLCYNLAFECKPYLRPMSSMTEEEIDEFILISDTVLWLGDKRSTCILSLEQMNWLNAHHFDYRGLIENGLAIEVTEDNNPYEN